MNMNMNINIKDLTHEQIKDLRVQLTEYDKNIPIQKRVKTFDDVLSYLGIKVNEFNDSTYNLTNDEIAYKKIKLIVKILNEGWQPDWNNSNEPKYYPWFYMDDESQVSSDACFSFPSSDSVNSHSTVGSRLVFKSRELAEYAGQQFINEYKDFFTL